MNKTETFLVKINRPLKGAILADAVQSAAEQIFYRSIKQHSLIKSVELIINGKDLKCKATFVILPEVTWNLYILSLMKRANVSLLETHSFTAPPEILKAMGFLK